MDPAREARFTIGRRRVPRTWPVYGSTAMVNGPPLEAALIRGGRCGFSGKVIEPNCAAGYAAEAAARWGYRHRVTASWLGFHRPVSHTTAQGLSAKSRSSSNTSTAPLMATTINGSPMGGPDAGMRFQPQRLNRHATTSVLFRVLMEILQMSPPGHYRLTATAASAVGGFLPSARDHAAPDLSGSE